MILPLSRAAQGKRQTRPSDRRSRVAVASYFADTDAPIIRAIIDGPRPINAMQQLALEYLLRGMSQHECEHTLQGIWATVPIERRDDLLDGPYRWSEILRDIPDFVRYAALNVAQAHRHQMRAQRRMPHGWWPRDRSRV